MEPTNRRRVLRALEVTIGSGQPFSSFGPGLDAFPPNTWDQCGLRIDPLVLRDRIAARYTRQLADGFLEEVRALLAAPPPLGRTAAQALGYRELLAHLAGTCTLEEALDDAIGRTRQFARRQRSWFGRDPRITWIDGADADQAVAALVARWRR
jgi:tRNA dimethylallyltransferase